MSRAADTIIKKLRHHGIEVHTVGATAIRRDQETESLNRNCGEFAPCWWLEMNVLYRRGMGIIYYTILFLLTFHANNVY